MVFFKLIARLPLPLLYLFADGMYVVLRFVVRYRWPVVLQNLQNAFPEKTPAEHRRLAGAFYRNLTDVVVETFKALTIPEEELRRRITMQDAGIFQDYVTKGHHTVLVMTSHLCNWEWSSLRARLEAPRVEVDVVYKTLSSPFFDQLMREIRGRFGILPLPMQGLLRNMIRRRNEPRIIGLVADQAAEMPETAYWTRFMNQETDFFTGTEKLARQFNSPVVFMSMRRVRRGHYVLTCERLAEPPYDALPPNAVIDNYIEKLEAAIRRQPADWLWSHKRWKHRRADFEKPA